MKTPHTISPFAAKVFSIVQKIPMGTVLTYSDVAQKAGRVGAARAVGNILNKNYDPRIPCHRVIRSNGSFGGYNRGVRKKALLLTYEGFRGCSRTTHTHPLTPSKKAVK